MIVNNILINTLVLCFSCGCNNNQTGKVNYDGALCHQNAAKMIIDRNISFSDIIDDYTCDGNGNPLIYDLEPIKNIIRLQLNGGLPNHCDGNQKPPGLPFNISSPNPPMPEPPTEKPSTSKVIITIHLPNATNVKIIENKEDLKELANRQYEINPATKIHITLNGPDMVNDQNWQPNISKFINGIGTELNPTVTVNIDWSKIDINSDDFPQKIKKLVKQIAVMIKESKFSPDKFTIIAPGQSANLAGDIGHVYKRMYPGESLGKIIAVDPIVPEKWMNVHVLNKTDADAVIGLVTVKPPVEVSLKFVVKVNDLPEVQPWCKEGDCSKVTGVKILQEIIKQKWKWFTHKYPNGTIEYTDILNSPYVFKYNPWIKDLNSYVLIVKENGATFEKEFTPQDYGSWNSSHVLENDVAIIEFKDEVDKPTYHIFVFSANPDKDFSMTRTGNYAKEFYKISKNSYYWLIDWSRKYDKMQHASDEEKVRMIHEVVNTTWKSVDYSLHLDKTVLISIGASNDVVMKLAKNIKKKYRTVKVILGINSNKSGMKDLAETVINVHSYIPTLRLRMEQITQEGIQMIVNNPYRTQPDCQRFNYECSEIYGVAVVFKIIQAQLNNKPLTKNLAPREFLSGTELDEVLIELEKQKERTTFIVNTIPSVYVRGEAGIAGDWKGSLDGLDNTRKWIKDNPGGKIFVLIYNRAFLKWVYELEKTLPENSYIIRYDISVAYIANPDVTNITNESIFYQMAEDIMTDIIERKIPSDQLTILSLVGDGASTIIAPLISRTLKHEINISTAKLILPFNPKHIPFDLEPEKTDANEVVAIYVPDILSCCNMDAGTININASTILTETCKEYGYNINDESNELRQCVIISLFELLIKNANEGFKITDNEGKKHEYNIWDTKIKIPPGSYSWDSITYTPPKDKDPELPIEPPRENSEEDNWLPTTLSPFDPIGTTEEPTATTANPSEKPSNANITILGIGFVEGKVYTNRSEVQETIRNFTNTNPDGNFVIIIANNETNQNEIWSEQLQNAIIKSQNVETPNLVIVIDGSEALSNTHIDDLYERATELAEQILCFLNHYEILPEKLSIFGYNYSPIISHKLGKLIKAASDQVIGTIYDLNPNAFLWNSSVPVDLLPVKTDAMLTVAMYTESNKSKCCDIATINIGINDCIEDIFQRTSKLLKTNVIECTQTIILENILDIIIKKFPIVKVDDEDVRINWLLEIPRDLSGDFEVSTINRKLYILAGYTTEVMITGRTKILNNIQKFLKEQPNGNFTIILTENAESDDYTWGKKLASGIIKQSNKTNHVSVINIPIYNNKTIYKDIRYYARKISKFIQENKISSNKLNIVGFGINSLLAYYLRPLLSQHKTPVARITVLNPPAAIFTNAPPNMVTDVNSTTSVVSLYTTINDSVQCCNLGQVNIFINNPLEIHPSCLDEENPEKCTFNEILKDMFVLMKPNVTVIGEDGNKYPLLKLPLDIKGNFTVMTVNRDVLLEIFVKANFKVMSGGFSIGKIKYGRESIVDDLKIFQNEHAQGNYTIILDGAEKINRGKWASELMKQILKNSKGEFVTLFNYSSAIPPNVKDTNARAIIISKLIREFLNVNNIPPKRLRIIGHKDAALISYHLNKLLEKDCTFILKIINVNPTSELQQIMVSESSKFRGTKMINLISQAVSSSSIPQLQDGVLNLIINNATVVQPDCKQAENPEQCSDNIGLVTILDSFENVISAICVTGDGFIYNILEIPPNIYVGEFQVIRNVWVPPPPEENEVPSAYEPPSDIPNSPPNLKQGNDSMNPESKVLIKYTYPNGTRLVLDLTMKSQEGLVQFLRQPYRRIIFIIINKQQHSDESWPEQIKDQLQSVAQTTESVIFPIVIDWTRESKMAQHPTARAYKVARDVLRAMIRLDITARETEIIAFGESAHLAGIIGQICKVYFHAPLLRIIALQPTKLVEFKDRKVNHRLHKSDAVQVISVVTETTKYGECCGDEASVQVIVGNPENGQTWCKNANPNPPKPKESDDDDDNLNEELDASSCSHESATNIFIKSYTLRPVKIVNYETNELLQNFPYNVATNISGIYLMPIKNYNPMHPDEIEPSKPVYPNGSSLEGKAYYPGGSYSWENGIKGSLVKDLTLLIKKNHKVMIIITGGDKSHLSWTTELANLTDHILIVKSYDAYYKQCMEGDHKILVKVAEQIANEIKLLEIKPSNLTLAGFGVSAHLAGLVSRLVKEKLNHVDQIIALNPNMDHSFKLPEKVKLKPNDAKHVMVLNTQADDEYVCCSLDLVTVMVNNPYTTQPGCELGDKECSNAFAIRVFLQAAKLQGNITLPLKQFTGTRLKGFPLNIKHWNTGVYYYIVDSDGKPMPDKKINVIMVGGYESSLLQSTNKLGEFSIIKSFLSSNLKNPRIFVIFETGDQSDKSWGRKMIEVIRRTSPEPALVLVVPINAYPNIEQTLKYQDHIVKNVYTILSKSKVKGEHLTIIGFGIGTVYSTRLTKIYLKLNEQNQQNTKVAVLIALNPAAALYTKIFGITPGIPDAKLVMNIHTEGKHLGHCCGASDIHVKVNDPFNIQPACKKVPAQSVLCSFRALSLYMIRAFGNDITNLPILEDSKFELAGWPYCKKEAKHGIYYIGAYRAELQGPVFIQYNRSPILPPVLGPNDFVIIPKVIKEFKSRVYIIIGSGDHSDHVLYNLDILQHQLRQGSQAGAYVISIPWDTAFQIRNSSLLSSSKNWGEFIRKSETISLLKRVAKDQAKSLVKSLLKYKLKLARTTIIAHGENGLLASLMCKEFRRITGSVPFRVIYLNILSNLFDPSLVSKNEMPSSSDGTTVLSIYTEKKKYGYCCDLGGLDIQIYPKNNSTEYPICSNTTDKEFCAHNMALEYLIRLIEYQYNDAHLPRLKIDGFPLKYNPKIKGTFHIYPNDVVKESWKLPDLQVSNTSEGVNHNLIVFRNLLKEYPLYQLLIILADSQSSKHFPGWPEQIEKIVKKKTADFRAKLFVYVLNWNTAIVGDKYPDHKAHTQDFVESIRNAKYIVSELKQASVPSENVNILGFGPSAMMAHLIGVLYRPRQIIHMNPHFIWFEDYRHLYNMYDSKPELRIKKLNHETFEIAQSVLVIQSESRKYGYCCEAGHVRVLINNPVVGQSWCARDRFCSYMSVISVFIDSLRNAPARVFNVNDPSEHLDGFPFWYDLDDENTYMMTTRYSGSIEHNPSGLVSPDEMKVEYSFTKEDINVWYKLNPKGRLYLVATDDTSGDRKWDRKLSRALKSVNVTNKVVVADWSRHIKLGITEETLNASRHLAKNIGSLLEESDYPAHQTTIIGFGLASLLASKIAKQIHILSATPIHQIFFLNPTKNIFDHKLVPEKDMPAITDANMVLLVETETSTIGMKDSVEKAVRVLVNNPDKPQPICSSAGKELYAQCSHRFAITFFISAHTKKVNAIEKGTGKILKNFPLEIDATLKGIGGVYYVNTTTQESGPNASTTMTPLLTTTPAQHSLFSSISTFPPIITDNKGSPESED